MRASLLSFYWKLHNEKVVAAVIRGNRRGNYVPLTTLIHIPQALCLEKVCTTIEWMNFIRIVVEF